jgi:predicted nucleic acid-binding protein
LQTAAIWVPPVILKEPTCRDPQDDKFIEAALGAEWRLIVARDRDLTVLEKPFGISILTPRGFLSSLTGTERRRLA